MRPSETETMHPNPLFLGDPQLYSIATGEGYGVSKPVFTETTMPKPKKRKPRFFKSEKNRF